MKKHKPRSQRRGFRRISKPKPPKTFADVQQLKGNEYYQTEDGIAFRTESTEVDAMVTLGDLLAKFYRFNEEQPPLAFRLKEDESQAIREKVYLVAMRGNFFIDIEKGSDTEGPHRCRLWFKTFSKDPVTKISTNYWLASLQLMGFYFNEEQMKEALLTAIAAQEFFMLPENVEIGIVP